MRLPSIFGDNMVLQRDARLPVWGRAAPGAQVIVRLADQEAVATADDTGRWRVTLAPLSIRETEGAPIEMTVTGDGETLRLTDVLLGDVWLCSGQSNMGMLLSEVRDAEREVAAADFPAIRLIQPERVVSDEPRENFTGAWTACRPETAATFSAAAYFFGRMLHRELGVPIGLIDSSWGGTPAEAWTSMEVLGSSPKLAGTLSRWDRVLADYPAARAFSEREMQEWNDAVARARAEGREPPLPPNDPIGPGHCHQPAGLFNAMIAPLVPYALRGAIWYQGESNTPRAYEYRALFPAMIRDWRRRWGQGDFPFLFVQISAYGRRRRRPDENAWAELREAQTMTLAEPNTAMAVTIDIGEDFDIHPKNKQEVGRRLALAALATVHGRDVVYSGPTYESMSVEGDAVRLRFRHIAGGLATSDGAPPRGFTVAGADRRFEWADAALDGDAVLVRSDAVCEPVAVRYAWADSPDCNLCNAEGLPASPFRTDDWRGLTELSEQEQAAYYGEPEAVEIPRAPGAITVDGDLSDWAAVAPLPLPFEGGRPGSVRLCWAEDGLYGAVSAAVGPPRLDRAEPWKGDCLELFVEKDCARAAVAARNCAHLVFCPDPEAGPGPGVARVGYGAHIYRGDVLGCQWRPTAEGYDMEFFIPTLMLEPARMEAGCRLGMNFALCRDGESLEVFFLDRYQLFVCQNPIAWGIVRLAP